MKLLQKFDSTLRHSVDVCSDSKVLVKFQKSHPGKDCGSRTDSLDGGLRPPSSFVNNCSFVRSAEEMSFVFHHILLCTIRITFKLGINEYKTV